MMDGGRKTPGQNDRPLVMVKIVGGVSRLFVDRSALLQFIVQLDEAFMRPGCLYMIGETTQLFEGWRDWTDQIEFAAQVANEDKAGFAKAVMAVQTRGDVQLLEESPADVIPLPSGFEQRARSVEMPEANRGFGLRLFHFDPYSVAFRFIARGDEQDYRVVLRYLEHGWVTVEELNVMLDALLPKFTVEVIQQDAQEFRRKYKGLIQMWRASPEHGIP